MKSTLGIVGMGVMGQNLSRNFARKGYPVSLYNRRVEGIEENVALEVIDKYEELSSAQGFEDIQAFIDSVERPRKIILMITAGEAVDKLLDLITPHLDEADIIIDGGNSYFKDSQRRYQETKSNGFHWVSMGVSGGAEGALNGPSLMPSGDSEIIDELIPILQNIAAKDINADPCCVNVGLGSSGHFVKMVHNGIEYGEMQLIAEIYDLLRHGEAKSNDEIVDIFSDWSSGENQSYILDITCDIVRFRNEKGILLDQILDVAKGKGTGIWASNIALELGVPVPIIQAAVAERSISEFEQLRKDLSKKILWSENSSISIQNLKQAYFCSRIVNHIQGFELIRIANEQFKWGIDLSELARIWTNGCIIRSALMLKLNTVLNDSPELLTSDEILQMLLGGLPDLKKILSSAINGQIALPGMSGALNYIKSMSRERSPMNLIQAQRDYFGSHTYQKIGDSEHYTTDWKQYSEKS